MSAGGEDAIDEAATAVRNAAAASDWGNARREDHPVIVAAMTALRALVAARPGDARCLEQLAILEHNVGRVTAARALYAEVNRLDPSRRPDDRERQAVDRLVPVVLTTAAECFALRDCAAIHHPSAPVVAYHFFWEDDWDYPDDDEPCDHEVAWVRYRPDDGVPVEVTTYFHGRLLTSECAASGARPAVCVQWGTHGTLPAGWKEIAGTEAALRRGFEAALRGGRVPDHPRKRQWPPRFPGTWLDYVRFDREVDARLPFRRKGWIATGRFANAILHDLFVPYNFHAKREWPDDEFVNL
jgi:hypothetical protein